MYEREFKKWYLLWRPEIKGTYLPCVLQPNLLCTCARVLGSAQFVEKNEASPREWYGGAVGLVGFDGHLNTGLTLRTVHVKSGVGTVRAGATLLFDR